MLRQPDQLLARAAAGFGVLVAWCELFGAVIAGKSTELLGIGDGLPVFGGRFPRVPPRPVCGGHALCGQ